jgi:peroxiredoxin Q/BCP|tara:strand:- start:3897 stop:4154 length:258 start_codon:yes stop_codon:yes gene_type:complete
VGISADPVGQQKEFDQKNSLGFTLLSDPEKKIASLLGAKRRGPFPNQRATYVIGQDRTLLGIVKSEKNMFVHADKALEILRNRSS